ncbi:MULTISPECIES: type II toxin-antitoxin system VapC family toxin [unclassified Aureimonas]|uniref:type II toxin-antitoxin system VapC family toxin n=1 Tax=unclassified Aureimonas TaxID=2615206 RepID=UPI001651AA08|nr:MULTISPECIES: type II toxin-antitoxin system VapC family toxin [unclassified Aureimonas]
MAAVYLDANILIESVEGPHADFLRLVRRLTGEGRRFVTSELTLAEVLTKPFAEASSDLLCIYEDLLAADGLVETLPVDRAVLRESARLRAEIGAKLPDMIHLATARLAGCEILVSNDKRLRDKGPIERLSILEAAKRLQLP